MNVSPFIKYSTYQIAKGLTPYDTGNLRHNALRLHIKNDNEWTISYKTSQAPYVVFLEEGTKNMRPRRFIEATALSIASYLKRSIEGKPTFRSHKKTMENPIDVDWNNQERKLRRISSMARYELIKDDIQKLYTESKNFEVKI